MFVDQVTIRVTAGTGGSGAMSLARRKYQAKGGPDGGDGGHGGTIYLKADANLSTLLDYRYKTVWVAERGLHGKGNNMTGRSGEDLYMPVPPGTIVEDTQGSVIGELLRAGDELRVARGGRGGRGNAKFATSTHRTPREWEPGEEGEDREIHLTLKLIADVGLVGEPNAGKSTLLSVISAARPKIADYPFTTLEPNLGVVGLSESRSLVVADIPGIIEGAHEGKGLGLRFLQHVERTRVLAFLIPLDSPDPQATYDQLRHEIRSYSEALFGKPHLVLLSKRDLIPIGDDVPELVTPGAIGTLEFSSAGRNGLEALTEALWSAVTHAKAEEAAMLAAEDESDPEWI